MKQIVRYLIFVKILLLVIIMISSPVRVVREKRPSTLCQPDKMALPDHLPSDSIRSQRQWQKCNTSSIALDAIHTES